MRAFSSSEPIMNRLCNRCAMMRTDAYEDEPHTQRDPEQLPEVKKKNGNMPGVI